MKLPAFALAFLLAASAAAQDQPVTLPSATAATAAPSTLDQARMIDDLKTLASPRFEGRRTGTEGNRLAGAFIQQRFAEIGLQPFGASFAQPFNIAASARNAGSDAVNYVGFIRGTAQPERFIVVSAHYDHLGIKNGKLYAGADDNASGVAAMLAVAAHFKHHRPAHTIVFAAFDGEEIGLRGARAFLGALPFPKAQLALNINFDMVSHNDRNELYAVGTRYTPSLVPVVAQAAARHTVTVKLGHETGAGEENWTGASDHGPFHEAGISFLYFGVEDHADYHQPGDVFEHVNQTFFGEVARLLVDVVGTADQQVK